MSNKNPVNVTNTEALLRQIQGAFDTARSRLTAASLDGVPPEIGDLFVHAYTVAEDLAGQASAEIDLINARLSEYQLEVTEDVDPRVEITEDWAVFNLWHLQTPEQGRSQKRKWYVPTTKLGDSTGSSRLTLKKGMCWHHSAVKNGASPHKRVIASYLESDPLPDIRPYLVAGSVSPPPAPSGDESWARRYAQAHRYFGHPYGKYNAGYSYHDIISHGMDLYENLPPEWVVWAGHGSNNFYSQACLDLHGAHNTFDVDLVREYLEYLYDRNRDRGHYAEGCELTVHGAWANKPTDPPIGLITGVFDYFTKKYPDRFFMREDFKRPGCTSIREMREAA